uniref:BspA family leucine-rich repeat surface protein n=1 Tax=viral metagenome TaxID=1070528 RepID=A0A6C0B8U1_9ZZZZ
MSYMFENCNRFDNGVRNKFIKISEPSEEVEKMSKKSAKSMNWITTKVTDMQSMFKNCSLFNSDLSQWDVSSVQNMSYMFYGCTNFTGVSMRIIDGTIHMSHIGGWDTQSVTKMAHMFEEAILFRADISKWNISNVTDFTDFDKECCFKSLSSPSNERDTTKDVYAIRTKLPKFQFPTGGKRTCHRNHKTRKGKRNRTKRYIKIYI